MKISITSALASTLFPLAFCAATAVSATPIDNQIANQDELASQLCYFAQNDIYDHKWMEVANFYRDTLETAIAEKVDICMPIESEAEKLEAKYLTQIDATKTTLVIRQ